jgi:hypothetical protein
MKRILFVLQIAALGAAVLIVQGCRKDEDPSSLTADFGAELATDWFKLTMKLTKEGPGFTPPVAARAYGYTGLTLYEAVVNGMPRHRSLQGQLEAFSLGTVPNAEVGKDYHWGLVANAALGYIVKELYRNATAANLQAIADLEAQYRAQFAAEAPEDVEARSIAYGLAVGEAMYAYAASDGQDLAYTTNFPSSYVPPVGPGMWKPTPPAFAPALQPYWGGVRPFLAINVSGSQPPAPPLFSTDMFSIFYAQALEVYTVTRNLTPEQEIIAKFWSDDPGLTATPPGHSISILNQVLEQNNADLELAAEAFAKVGMAVHDAFISCWKCKYDFNLLRPITYIQEVIDPGYTTLLATPPFPEYTSGHSAQSGAVSQVLSDLFGYNYAFSDRTHVDRTDIDGSPRSFTSFFHMAQEAAISRLYGGIHYRDAIDLGVNQGKVIGRNISNLNFRR